MRPPAPGLERASSWQFKTVSRCEDCTPPRLLPENLKRLRRRSTSAKRSLALREFALGTEALERFFPNGPLRRVYECIFGVLALESDAVDPRSAKRSSAWFT